MRKSSESNAARPGGARDDHPSSALRAAGDRWVEILRAAEAPRTLGRVGSYDILGEVRGGQGLVFRARQAHTGREVALKRPVAGGLTSAADRRRFEREVETAASLSHPGIVAVLGVVLWRAMR